MFSRSGVSGMLQKTVQIGIKVFATLLILLIIALLLLRFMQPASSFHLFGIQAYTVLSNSMQPAFQTGDIIITRKMDATDIQVDDVITFRQSDNRFITHRVNAIQKEQDTISFQTKGDANNTIDKELVPIAAITGKKVFHIPYAGYVARFMSSPVGIIIFIILPLTLYGVLSFYQRSISKQSENVSKI